jgi:hypothetical protein
VLAAGSRAHSAPPQRDVVGFELIFAVERLEGRGESVSAQLCCLGGSVSMVREGIAFVMLSATEQGGRWVRL